MAATSSTGTANCSAMVAEVAGSAYCAGLDFLALRLSAGYHSWTGILRPSRAASVTTKVSVPTANLPVGRGSDTGANPRSARGGSGTNLGGKPKPAIRPSASTAREKTTGGPPVPGSTAASIDISVALTTRRKTRVE